MNNGRDQPPGQSAGDPQNEGATAVNSDNYEGPLTAEQKVRIDHDEIAATAEGRRYPSSHSPDCAAKPLSRVNWNLVSLTFFGTENTR